MRQVHGLLRFARNDELRVDCGEDDFCWLCRRPLGAKMQWHHPVPKAKKGRETVPVHPICHKTIHAIFTNAELARLGSERERLLENETLARFVRWVKGKPPDFNAPVRRKL